ncbi:MAG: NgoFVII family restriction endonuclease [Anaerolineae bacterium]|nr:NgoFVII family restriction endonuclease [Anaerolineae bacterium]
MPRIFDNTHNHELLPSLIETLKISHRADFCVGYFNLRGWGSLQPYVDQWEGGIGNQCRLLIGMYRPPEEDVRQLFSLLKSDTVIDQQQVVRLKKQVAENFRQQLMLGAPTDRDERGLRQLAEQLASKKLVVKLFLRYPLHAKLYLLFREDYNNPATGYLGSSNLTFSGLSGQGELNIDVLEHDACGKLAQWFDERWEDRWTLDISDDLIKIIDESWARRETLTPYEVYLKMAYHLSQEARLGLREFKLPREFQDRLFEYQAAAVQIAAHHLNKRGGVMLGDVVGLGKTLMATTLARIFQDDYALETLVICPKNLVPMWKKYLEDYRIIGTVLSLGLVTEEYMHNLRRYRLIVIDESHNLRNREGKRYRAIQDYITANESKCVLLSATPYNKSFNDLSAQLRLFIPEEYDLGIRPEQYLTELGGEAEFMRKHQSPVRSILAFEKSEHIDDWRDLMRLYLVRRTRSFILNNYTETDQRSGRQFLRRGDYISYFPVRSPKTIAFESNEQYQRLYSDEVVNLINELRLPRYGLGLYISDPAAKKATPAEQKQLENLSKAGKRLMGFSRTNLFKRLESSGAAFVLSVDRHILRNYIFLHAIQNGLDLPIGTLDAETLDPSTEDEDTDSLQTSLEIEDSPEVSPEDVEAETLYQNSYEQRAAQAYQLFTRKYKKRFRWIRPALFTDKLREALEDDINRLLQVMEISGGWNPDEDTKLQALFDLIARRHSNEKVLVFSQFADTVRYLEYELAERGVDQLMGVTGQSSNPTELAWQFSPTSNEIDLDPKDELRVLVSTDVLSEGQNLQDSAIIVNYDLPWAIIRLVQRAGRVDRIGQQAEQILCYSFLPAEGVENIIRLRARVRQRLHENGEVVGSDEQFFEDDELSKQLSDLYTEKSGILDTELDTEVDLASYAYQIWANATKHNPALAKKIADLPDVVYSTRHYIGSVQRPEGVVVYMQTAEGADALAWLDENGNSITQSQYTILRIAECSPDTPPQPRHPNHHELVGQAVDVMTQQDIAIGGQLGRPNSARRRTYDRLKAYHEDMKRTAPLLIPQELERAIDDLYRYPLRSTASDTLNRQLRAGIDNEDLAQLVIALRGDDRLSIIQEDGERQEPRILCSLGLFSTSTEE